MTHFELSFAYGAKYYQSYLFSFFFHMDIQLS